MFPSTYGTARGWEGSAMGGGGGGGDDALHNSTARLGEMVNFHFFSGSSGIHIIRHKAFDIAFDVVRWPYQLNDQLAILLKFIFTISSLSGTRNKSNISIKAYR